MSRRVPDHLKLVRGTFRADRAAPVAQPAPTDPRPPAILSKGRRRFWRELQPLVAYMMADGDRAALALACEALEQHRATSAYLAEHGTTYEAKTESGAVLHRVRPEVAIASDAWRRALRGLAEFGLTPASRCKVPQPLKPARPNPFAVLDK